MKIVSIFIAELGNPKAILAVSALVRAMKEMNKLAILHCVWRQGQGNVVIGVLTRNVSEKDSVPDSFYFKPNEQQQEASNNLVKMFDVAPTGKEEVLPLKFTPNPVLEHMSKTWGYCDSVLQLNLVQEYCPCQLNNVELNYEPCKTINAKGLVAPAIAAGLGALTHTLGTLVPVIRANGFATAAVATAIGIVVGSFR